MIISAGATDVTMYFELRDPATFIPETGLVIANLDASYVRDRAAAVKNDLSTPGGFVVNSAHTDNAAIEVDAANTPGLYRVDFPDAAFATGVDRVRLCINGAAIDPAYIEVELGAKLHPTQGGTTFTSATGAALTVSSTGANGAGLVVSGNGSGAGIDIDGGATGVGVDIDAAANVAVDIDATVAGSGAVDIRNANATTGNALLLQTEQGNTVLIKQIADGNDCGIKIESAGTGIYVTSVNDNALEFVSDRALGFMANGGAGNAISGGDFTNSPALGLITYGTAPTIQIDKTGGGDAIYIRNYAAGDGIEIDADNGVGIRVIGGGGKNAVVVDGSPKR